MIIIHTKGGSRTLKKDEKVEVFGESCWIDLINPTDDEEHDVESLLKIDIPTRAELRKNEALNRFYENDGALFLSAGLLSHADTDTPGFDVVTFIITGKHLITCRYNKPKAFDNFIDWLSRHPEGFDSGDSLFAGLFRAISLRTAEILEKMATSMEVLSQQVLAENDLAQDSSNSDAGIDLRKVLKKIGRSGSVTIRLKESMGSLSRMAVYYLSHRKDTLNKAVTASLERTMSEFDSLKDHVDFLTNEVNFLVTTTISLITVQQNAIIKIFSVAAVAFLPPTLIASIYGMNFHDMPELSSSFGYPLAVVAMLVSALLPLAYFRRKGWL